MNLKLIRISFHVIRFVFLYEYIIISLQYVFFSF